MSIKNLKNNLVEEAYRMIREEGIENFSVRSLSKRVNVSHTALYRHFKSSSDLIFTVVKSGFEQLTSDFRSIRQRNDLDEVEKFNEGIYVYVEFALNNSNIYKLMYNFDLIKKEFPEDLIDAYKTNYSELIGFVDECFKAGRIKDGTVLSVANTSWSFIHGLTILLIDNILLKIKRLDFLPSLVNTMPDTSEDEIREVISFSVNSLFFGILSK